MPPGEVARLSQIDAGCVDIGGACHETILGLWHITQVNFPLLLYLPLAAVRVFPQTWQRSRAGVVVMHGIESGRAVRSR